MKILNEKEKSLAANLKMYASGSGCLSFTFVSYALNTHGHALSEKVTEQDIKEYLKSEKASEDLKNNYKICKDTNGEFCLVLNVKKISDNFLEIPFFDKVLLAEYKKDERYDFGFKLTELKGDQFEIRHISTKAAVKYFLDNETRLTKESEPLND